jgi:probable F420-dependent oxidoreductase
MIIAHIAWDLQKASDGRFILGLGTQVKGHNERRFSVKFESPGPKMREIVLALRHIWDCWQNGPKLAFKGQFYRFDLMTPFFNPGPIANRRCRSTSRASITTCAGSPARYATACTCIRSTARSILREYVHPAVEEGLSASGRKRSDFTYTTSSFVVVGDTEEELAKNRRAVKQQIAFYASTRTYEPVLATHGWQDSRRASTGNRSRRLGPAWPTLITDEMLDTFAVTGSYDTVGRQAQAALRRAPRQHGALSTLSAGARRSRLPQFIKEFNA